MGVFFMILPLPPNHSALTQPVFVPMIRRPPGAKPTSDPLVVSFETFPPPRIPFFLEIFFPLSLLWDPFFFFSDHCAFLPFSRLSLASWKVRFLCPFSFFPKTVPPRKIGGFLFFSAGLLIRKHLFSLCAFFFFFSFFPFETLLQHGFSPSPFPEECFCADRASALFFFSNWLSLRFPRHYLLRAFPVVCRIFWVFFSPDLFLTPLPPFFFFLYIYFLPPQLFPS